MRAVLLIAAACTFRCWAAEDPVAIMRRSVEWDQKNWKLSKDYTYIQHVQERFKDGQGKVAHLESQTDEILFLFGQPYTRRIAKNGQPLKGDAEKKEEQKLNKAAEERRRDQESGGRKRQEWERKRAEERAFFQEIPDAYRFTLLRSDQIDGIAVWVIQGTPRPEYRPKNSNSKILQKIKPTFWIDKQEYRWVRVDAEVLETISYGLVLARLNKGTTLTMKLVRVNNEVWMPQHLVVQLDARLALLKKISGEVEISWRDFRKFQTDSKLVAIE